MKSKPVLLVISVIMLLMGVAGMIPSWELGSEPMWHAIAKVVIGALGIWVALMDKPKRAMTPPAMPQ